MPVISVSGGEAGNGFVVISNDQYGHSAEEWAAVTALGIMEIHAYDDLEKRAQATKLRNAIAKAMVPYFEHPFNVRAKDALNEIVHLASKTRWAFEFSSPEVQNLILLFVEKNLNSARSQI